MEKHLKTIILIFIVLIGVSVIYVFIRTNGKPTDINTEKQIVPVRAAEVKETSVVSPDGKYTFKMRGSVFTNTENTSGSVVNIYPEASLQNTNFLLPFNAFSPDDKYVYIKTKSGDTAFYNVFMANGKDLYPSIKTVEVSSLFNTKYPDYVITDVTGWASPTLLIINTDKVKGGVGPSFWFDVPTKSFYRLSTRFN